MSESNAEEKPAAPASPGREENLLILKMLQDGVISADQAAELLQAVKTQTPPVPPTPPTPPTPPVPPPPPGEIAEASAADISHEPEAFQRARARIAAARERVAGVQERLAAAEEKIAQAQNTPNAWEQVADALKDVPGARSVADALRGIDPGRIAANARRQARRVARSMRSSLEDINIDFSVNLAEQLQGEPQLTAPREATAPVPPGGVLRVQNTLGDIEVVGADVPEARAAGVLKIWSADRATAETLAADIKLVAEEGAEGPTIRVLHPVRVRRVALDLKVFVPESITRVTLMSPAGDVSARNLKSSGVVLVTKSGDARASEIVGDVVAETASGDIALQGVIGNVSASTASGDIDSIRISGQNFRGVTQSGDVALQESTVQIVSIETVSGDAAVKTVTGRSLKVRAVSGDTTAENVAFEFETHLDTVSGYVSLNPRGPVNAGTFQLITLSGDAAIHLPREANASLDINTKGGDLRGKVIGADGKTEKIISASGMVNVSETVGTGPGARITLSTVSGDVSIEQDSPVIEIG